MGRRRNLSELVRFGRLSVRLDGFVVSEPEFRFRELRNFRTRNLSELIRPTVISTATLAPPMCIHSILE